MNIFWVCAGNLEQIGDKLTSTLASTRYRVIIPVEKLASRGYGNTLIMTNSVNFKISEVDFDHCDVMVVSKSFTEITITLVEEAKRRGIPIVVDNCDNYFSKSELRDAQTRLVNLSDALVSSTPGMRNVLKVETGRESVIIGDPYENKRGEPALPLIGKLKLLWFGHPSSYNGIAEIVPRLKEFDFGMPTELKIMTKDVDGINEKITNYDRKLTGDFHVNFRPWSLQAVSEELESTDIVVIPVQKSEFNEVKSANRLIESMWAGRFVVASPIASYREFSDFACIVEDIAEGIREAIRNPERTIARISQSQEYISQHYSPEVVSEKWERVLLSLKRDRFLNSKNMAERPLGPVKLNLGCGDKILEGYVNVDVAETRNGRAPDLICDLRELKPFADESADEILSVHVIEHFWRWEALDILKEWVRVLRPGGKMILECPNLVEACKSLLEDTDTRAGTGTDGRSTMWVFYGDPSWKDPLMTHRWGYTPTSLIRLLEEAGLEGVRQEPAQFKMREPRDMRITGIKRLS